MSSYPTVQRKPYDNLLINQSQDVYTRANRIFQVPDGQDGNYITTLAVGSGIDLSDAQIAQLETAVSAITGVLWCKCIFGPSLLETDSVLPADTAEKEYKLTANYRLIFDAIEVDIPQA